MTRPIDATLTQTEFEMQFGLKAVHLRLMPYRSVIDADELLAREGEIAFMLRHGSRRIWTLMEDAQGQLCLLSGMHFVQRIGLVASHRAAPYGVAVMVEVNDLCFRPH